MKILIVTQYFYPESFRVNEFTKELVTRGHDVTVLTGFPQYPYGDIYPGYGFNTEYEKTLFGAKVIRLKVSPRGHNSLGLLKNCYSFVYEGNKWVKKCNEKFDIIYVFGLSPVTVGLPAVKYKKKFGTPVFFNIQDLWPESVIEVLGIKNRILIGIINKIVDKIYNNSDLILCSSNGFVKNISDRGVANNKLVFWPQFFKTPEFVKLSKPKCYDENYFNIVFTGNIGYAQGLDLVVSAAALIKDKPVRWFLVGDGRAKSKLINKVKSCNLENNIIFIDKVSEHEANAYIRFADCAYVSFSESDLFDITIPAKLQTYLACGTPILGAVSGESADIIKEADCGFVTLKTADDVAKTVLKMAKLSKEELDVMRNNAFLYFNENFTLKIIVDKFEEMINNTNLHS